MSEGTWVVIYQDYEDCQLVASCSTQEIAESLASDLGGNTNGLGHVAEFMPLIDSWTKTPILTLTVDRTTEGLSPIKEVVRHEVSFEGEEIESPLEIRSGLSLGERPPGGSHADPYVWLTVEGSDIPAVRDTFDKLKASLIQATIPLVAGQERSLSEPALERWKQQVGIV